MTEFRHRTSGKRYVFDSIERIAGQRAAATMIEIDECGAPTGQQLSGVLGDVMQGMIATGRQMYCNGRELRYV